MIIALLSIYSDKVMRLNEARRNMRNGERESRAQPNTTSPVCIWDDQYLEKNFYWLEESVYHSR